MALNPNAFVDGVMNGFSLHIDIGIIMFAGIFKDSTVISRFMFPNTESHS